MQTRLLLVIIGEVVEMATKFSSHAWLGPPPVHTHRSTKMAPFSYKKIKEKKMAPFLRLSGASR